MSAFSESGRIRVRTKRKILRNKDDGGANAHRDRPILLRPEHVPQPDGRRGPIRHILREHQRNVHRQTRALRLQRQPPLLGHPTDEHRTEAHSRALQNVQSLLLADFRRASISCDAPNRLPADWKARYESSHVIFGRMLMTICNMILWSVGHPAWSS